MKLHRRPRASRFDSLYLLAAAALVAIAPSSCSCGDPELVVGAGGTAATTGTLASDTTATGQATTFAGGECPSQVICGDGACCPEGDECFLGACVAPCASQVRCGDGGTTCCNAGDVCLSAACVVPGAVCVDWTDCNEGEFCEPTLGKCLPQPVGEDLCEVLPEFLPVTPVVEWSWTSSAIQPSFVQVVNTPVVVDLEKDGTPDVVIVTSTGYSAAGAAYLRALDGATGVEKWPASSDVYLDANRVQPRGTPAGGDIDGDGFVEIVSPKMGGGLIAFEHDGTVKWTSRAADDVTPWNTVLESATVAIADLEGDGSPEIAVGGAVFDATGRLLFDGGQALASQSGYGAVSILADVDADGVLEVVGGKTAYRADGTALWTNPQTEGYPAIGNLDLDANDEPELVVVSAGTVRVHDAATGTLLASLDMPGEGAGGPPTIANFDDDPEPEFASANGSAYAVFDYSPTPTPTITVKWSSPTQDLSSNRTGSSVFDFQGDGAAEVVYGDECYFRVYDGADGNVVYEVPNSSATIHEYPVVVDVDGDNNTEVVVVANDVNTGPGTCPYPIADVKHGVFVYGDPNNNWVRTRRVWNQHAYHIVNVGSDGSLPVPEPPSWIVPPGFNNYRQSNQGAGVFNGPDLRVTLDVSLDSCPAGVTLRASVFNAGSLGVPAGVHVDFYRTAQPMGVLLGSAQTTMALLPGQFEVVTLVVPEADAYYVVVDGSAGMPDEIKECLEDNNGAEVSGVTCPGIQ